MLKRACDTSVEELWELVVGGSKTVKGVVIKGVVCIEIFN
jgi:hypothetical protein